MALTSVEEYLNSISNPAHREFLNDVLNNIKSAYPQLNLIVKWNKPMFTAHGTFILAFSCSSGHIGVAPEPQLFAHFIKDIESAGYTHGKRLFRINFTQQVKYVLIDGIINYTLQAKAECKTFWMH